MHVCFLTAEVDNANSRRIPDEAKDRFLGFEENIWQRGLVISSQSERHGTIQLSRIFNIRRGNDTFV